MSNDFEGRRPLQTQRIVHCTGKNRIAGTIFKPNQSLDISLTLPTIPLCRRTLIPWGWVPDFVRILATMPSVSRPER